MGLRLHTLFCRTQQISAEGLIRCASKWPRFVVFIQCHARRDDDTDTWELFGRVLIAKTFDAIGRLVKLLFLYGHCDLLVMVQQQYMLWLYKI